MSASAQQRVCRRHRGHQRRSNVDDRSSAQRAGADRFLAKPFALAELVSTLDSRIDPRATS
jgi:DNA-binding response OmpR family regulator